MTWPEVEQALASGTRTVILGVGSTEQHGLHLPLCTDSVHAGALAERVAAKLADALVAPTIVFGCSDHHMTFPGTISFRKDTLRAVLEDCCASLAKHGFERIGLISGHGGNFGPIGQMLPALQAAAGSTASVAFYGDLMRFVKLAAGPSLAAGFPIEAIGGHADLPETAVLLALRRELVHMDRAQAGLRAGYEETAKRVFDGLKAMSPIGVLGDPVGATPELGQEILAGISEDIAAYFRTLWG